MTLRSKMEELIRELEAERGCPIQIQIDTPESEGGMYGEDVTKGRVYVGAFEERAVKVQRGVNMDSRYEHDVTLLEMTYSSFKAFKEKSQELSEVVLYGPIYYMKDMVTSHFRRYIGEDVSELAWDTDEDMMPKFKFEVLNSLLDKHHVSYVTFPFEISPGGVYNDWMKTLGARELSADDLKEATGGTEFIVKVADIFFEKMK